MRLLALLLVLGCDDASTEEVDPDFVKTCSPLYTPSFADLHERTLLPSCTTGACHGDTAPAAYLNFQTPAGTYTALVGDGSGTRLVVPGDQVASVLIQRIDSSTRSMPPGQPLSDEERCVIHKWVESGAGR